MRKFLFTLFAIPIVGALLLFAMSSRTTLELESPVQVLGMKTPVRVRAGNPHGIRRVTAWIEQNGARHSVFDTTEPATRLWFWGKEEPPRQVSFEAGKERAQALHDGKARLVIEAQGNDFRANTASLAFDVDINTKPPAVSVDGFQHYINQGGAELVLFTASGYWTEAGVRVGEYTFRSFPMPGTRSQPGEKSQRFCLFAFPWDVPANTIPVVYARNPAGAEARGHFWHKVFPKKFRVRDLELSDSFLQKVTDQIEPQAEGDLLTRFLKINGELRRKNNRELADLRLKTEEKILWSGPFLQLGNSKVESQFADTRNYVYQGKKVDRQTHLGFDLSVVQRVPVVAANDGRVVHAGPIGIYGNCIVVDHGYALQSIYAHLSEIEVRSGDMVKKGQTMGRSGSTGLAGGDHLHFSMQIDGVQVNPVEWWDGHWIQDRILSKIPPRSELR
jgi:murein DD-endopeptidase MepM/ murein hydrolase activator NlpD